MPPSGGILFFKESILSEHSFDQDLYQNPQIFINQSVKHFKESILVNIHHFYITGDIDEVDKYIDMINEIKTASPNDTIMIYLNTPGGNLSTTIQIISAIEQSSARVITSLEGEVCSAGTMLFLAGHEKIVNNNTSFMIHNYSHGPFGKGHEVAQRVKFTEKYFRTLARSFYKNFLTAEEIEEVCSGKDMWMEADEVRERLLSIENAHILINSKDVMNPVEEDSHTLQPD